MSEIEFQNGLLCGMATKGIVKIVSTTSGRDMDVPNVISVELDLPKPFQFINRYFVKKVAIYLNMANGA